MPSASEFSRVQSFRQSNRSLPCWRQFRKILFTVLVVVAYSYALLWSSPQSPYDVLAVLKQNSELHVEYQIRQAQRQQQRLLDRQRRYNATAAKYLNEKKERQRKQEEAKQRLREKELLMHYDSKNSNKARHTSNTTAGDSANREEGEQLPPISEWVIFFRFLSTFVTMLGMCFMTRLLVLYYIRPNFASASSSTSRSTNRSTATTPRDAARRRQQQAFRVWAQRLNQQRAQQGERPLSLESLRLVVRNRDYSGNDYEQLLRFDEEAGPAVQSLLQSMGATQDEIERCPRRVLTQGDDLLQSSEQAVVSSSLRPPPHCAVCLEQYELNDEVRTIPCFHTFHARCIDQWLARKAACPICKHPAVG